MLSFNEIGIEKKQQLAPVPLFKVGCNREIGSDLMFPANVLFDILVGGKTEVKGTAWKFCCCQANMHHRLL